LPIKSIFLEVFNRLQAIYYFMCTAYTCMCQLRNDGVSRCFITEVTQNIYIRQICVQQCQHESSKPKIPTS